MNSKTLARETLTGLYRYVFEKFWIRFALVLIVALTLNRSWSSGAIFNGPIFCTFRLITGIPCPFCGSTRAAAALTVGEFSEAIKFNLVGAGISIFGVAMFMQPKIWEFLRSKFENSNLLLRIVAPLSLILLHLSTWIDRIS